MRKQEKIAELLELMKVPEVAKVIFLALDEAKGKLKDEIDRYRKAENLLKKAREAVQKDSYRFELKKSADEEWQILNISPQPPAGLDIDSIIIKDVLPHLSLNLTSPGGEIFNEFISKEKNNYNIQFIKFTESHIFGIIKEIFSHKEEGTGSEIEVKGIADGYKALTIEEKYKEIFYYMEKEPSIRDFLLDCFFILLRPKFGTEDVSLLS